MKKTLKKKAVKKLTQAEWNKLLVEVQQTIQRMCVEISAIKKGLDKVDKALDEQDKALDQIETWCNIAESDSPGPFGDDDEPDGVPVPAGSDFGVATEE